ncbi:uncharacterized protein PV07_10197 [Cladophialophora immunda]|uniref:Major facilitator superfamily (MFS) profile domain-containing protein n=1 Tax=Cladophialophora immunda TaxID=569365 RepID=A0A0D1Z9V4_9EURO|nr:uncharacterized protein PV07_10197 [Cladophialophora immunda]KIW24486.1 hypothetical protein PV07_10197 [Cladophialophora immunda]
MMKVASSTQRADHEAAPVPSQRGEAVDEHEDAERNYDLGSPKFWTIVVGMYLVIFLVALDRSIIATAIPRIPDEFDSIQDVAWYGSAYTLALCLLQRYLWPRLSAAWFPILYR